MRIGVRLVGTRAWAQAVIRGVESNAVQRLERYPAEDVGMDPTGTGILDAEFHEEPHLEEAQIPEEVPNAIRLVIMRVHKKLCIQARNCFVTLCELAEPTRWRSMLRVNPSVPFARRTNLRKVSCL